MEYLLNGNIFSYHKYENSIRKKQRTTSKTTDPGKKTLTYYLYGITIELPSHWSMDDVTSYSKPL